MTEEKNKYVKIVKLMKINLQDVFLKINLLEEKIVVKSLNLNNGYTN